MASWIWPASYSVLTLALYQKKIGQVQVREKPEQRNPGEVTSSLGASGSASVQSLASQGSGEGKHVGDCSGLRRMPQTLAHLCGGLMPLTLCQPLSWVLEVPSRAKQGLLELKFWSSKSENEINRCVNCQEVIKAEKENKAGLRVDGGGMFVKLSVGWT